MVLLLGDHGAADGHDRGDDAVDALGRLVFGGLQIAGRILGDGDVGGPSVQRHYAVCTKRSSLTPRGRRPHRRGPAVAARRPLLLSACHGERAGVA
jgi:hypothetical protein